MVMERWWESDGNNACHIKDKQNGNNDAEICGATYMGNSKMVGKVVVEITAKMLVKVVVQVMEKMMEQD